MAEGLSFDNIWLVKKDKNVVVVMKGNDEEDDFVLVMEEVEEEAISVCKLSTIDEEEIPLGHLCLSLDALIDGDDDDDVFIIGKIPLFSKSSWKSIRCIQLRVIINS